MDIRAITPTYAVSPQIDPEDVPAIKEAGFTTIICNRPDAEVPPSHRAGAMQAAAEAAGLVFVDNPVTHQGLNMEMVHAQSDGRAGGKTLAYCASGTRSTIVWALGEAVGGTADDILNTASKAGYDLGGMRPQLVSLGAS
jgi:uncharacterized protein (TIGR01244 family)